MSCESLTRVGGSSPNLDTPECLPLAVETLLFKARGKPEKQTIDIAGNVALYSYMSEQSPTSQHHQQQQQQVRPPRTHARAIYTKTFPHARACAHQSTGDGSARHEEAQDEDNEQQAGPSGGRASLKASTSKGKQHQQQQRRGLNHSRSNTRFVKEPLCSYTAIEVRQHLSHSWLCVLSCWWRRSSSS